MSNDIGVIGLGVMGSNLALNIAEKGFCVAAYTRTASKVEAFLKANSNPPFDKNLSGFSVMKDFVASLKVPRKVLILVPAGAATQSVIEELCGVLDKNDIIVDTGNANFLDQDRRATEIEALGLRFLGMGVSGGEEGARKGPAFFPGGTLSVWAEIKTIIEAAAAKAEDGQPCVTMNGRGGAGSCVKMYHNAGEYAVLQIWAEVVDILRVGGLSDAQVADVLKGWSKRGFLTSYMLDITIAVLEAKDKDGGSLITKTKDCVGSKGTGLWSVEEALKAAVPVPGLAAAVMARQMSMERPERSKNSASGVSIAASGCFKLTPTSPEVEQLYAATQLAIIASYAQMFQALRKLDDIFKFGMNLPKTIATFRAGCILKGYLLQPMTKAFEANPNLSNLLVAFTTELNAGLNPYRVLMGKVVQLTTCPCPVFLATLTYINAMFSATLPYGQVVSLQRDVFGRHGFERLDQEGRFNHQWPQLQ